MRAVGIGVVGSLALVLLALPAGAAGKGGKKYDIVITRTKGPFPRDGDGKLAYRVSFDVKGSGKEPPAVRAGDTAVIYEDGKEVARVALTKSRPKDLTLMLALDVSGSMARPSKRGVSKMAEAQEAARGFIGHLNDTADAGLILFDDKLQLTLPPAGDPAAFRSHRQQILDKIAGATPRGGTAYLDAALKSLQILRGVTKERARAVVLMTDGVDLNSEHSEREVIALAKAEKIPVHVIGVGDPGWKEPVSTVLVLDHSKSMEQPTGADRKTKIEALHDAGGRFARLMRPGARVTVLPFSSRVERPEDFSENKEAIRARISRLTPEGGTSLYDATLAGIETVAADPHSGKKYVVAMTDGVDEDPGSRHDPEEVIARAREAKVPLYMLGLGAKGEINEKVMRQMAERTGGKFFHAENQQALTEFFEALSVEIHGDGINEEALRRLAQATGGQYYAASDASKLKLVFEEVADALRADQTVTFVSRNQRQDGTVSNITIEAVDAKENVISNKAQQTAARFGLVVPEVDYLVYLVLLGMLLGLLFLPAWLKRGSAQPAVCAPPPPALRAPPVARLVPPRR
jgi:Mg-chelatase subunit ChlD